MAEAIFSASRVDNDDAVAAWEKHNATLHARTEWLNGQRFDALHYSGPGTDLTIGLATAMKWQGGASTAKNGINCNANIPTEEVFTTPHARHVTGHVVSSRGLSYQGLLIEGIVVWFEDGRIVDAKATRGGEVLNKLLDTDEGARRLGEVALVPHSSSISKSGVLFFNTLFDDARADPSPGRQQEPDPHRLDDWLALDRYRWCPRRRQACARIPERRVGLSL